MKKMKKQAYNTLIKEKCLLFFLGEKGKNEEWKSTSKNTKLSAEILALKIFSHTGKLKKAVAKLTKNRAISIPSTIDVPSKLMENHQKWFSDPSLVKKCFGL